MRSRASRWIALIAVPALLLVACGQGSGAGEESPVTLPAGEPGPAEDEKITVAIPFPDVTMYSMYVVGTELGYYEEEGLTVEVITADDPNAAVVSGSADIGVNSAGAVIEALNNDLDLELLGGHFCRQSFDFAVQPGVESAQDLAGADVVLAGQKGDLAEFERRKVLAQEGWKLGDDVKAVYPGPDSATWRQFFLTKRIQLMPFFGDDRPALQEYGANFAVQALRNWPNDLHTAGSGWLAENPNSAVRFLRASMKAVAYIQAPGPAKKPENKGKVLDIYRQQDFDVAALAENDTPWVLDGHFMCENLHYGEQAWRTTIENQRLEDPGFSSSVDLAYLKKAQELLELDNAPPATLEYP